MQGRGGAGVWVEHRGSVRGVAGLGLTQGWKHHSPRRSPPPSEIEASVAHQRSQASGCFSSLLTLFIFLLGSNGPDAQGNVYRNEKFGYAVFYPPRWFPSGNVYSNAFELRNYDPKSPESVLERNRASVIFVDTVNESAAVSDRFLDHLDTEPPFCVDHFSIENRRGVRVPRRVPAQRPGRGAARALPSGQATGAPNFFFAIDAYIANGKHLLSIEARTPAEADPAVIEDIMRIQESVKFQTPPVR